LRAAAAPELVNFKGNRASAIVQRNLTKYVWQGVAIPSNAKRQIADGRDLSPAFGQRDIVLCKRRKCEYWREGLNQPCGSSVGR
jgi:hypothetical protein